MESWLDYIEYMDKKILSIKFPHIYFESEKLRCSFGNQTVVISNTNHKTGIIIDSNNSDLTIGSFVKDININYKLLVVDYNYTNKISILIKNYLLEFSPIVEINNFKNYFIDLTGTEKLFGNIIDTSEKIMLYFKETYKFTIKMGIGSNLLVSHIASSYNTNSIYYILNEDVFLESTSIKNLPNIENKYKRIISDDYNISKLRQIKNISLEDLKLMFGETGRYLYDYSNNVFRNYLIKNKVSKTTCPWGILKKEINPRINDDSEIKHLVFGLITDMCIVMREENVISNNLHGIICNIERTSCIRTKKGQIKSKILYNLLRKRISGSFSQFKISSLSDSFSEYKFPMAWKFCLHSTLFFNSSIAFWRRMSSFLFLRGLLR